MGNAGAWVGIFVLIFGGIILFQSLSYEYFSDVGPGPGFFPLWASGALIVLTFFYIIISSKKEKILFRDILPKKKELAKVIGIFLSILLFIILAPYTGFSIAGSAMLFFLLIPGYRWYWALGISVTVTVLVFLLFQQLLDIPLPVNSYGW
ncbi:tripartite tricarboxylate transporter TctB family protein [Bacillaceae bacterium]